MAAIERTAPGNRRFSVAVVLNGDGGGIVVYRQYRDVDLWVDAVGIAHLLRIEFIEDFVDDGVAAEIEHAGRVNRIAALARGFLHRRMPAHILKIANDSPHFRGRGVDFDGFCELLAGWAMSACQTRHENKSEQKAKKVTQPHSSP